MTNVDELIKARQKVHGAFDDWAKADQGLKECITKDFREMNPAYIVSGLEAILGKIARILTGQSDYLDHWEDIQGYSRAVQKFLPDFKMDIDKAEKVLHKVSMTRDKKCAQAACPCAAIQTEMPITDYYRAGKMIHTPGYTAATDRFSPFASNDGRVIIQTYDDIQIETIDAKRLCPSHDIPSAGEIDRKKIKLACDLTMKKVDADYVFKEAAAQLIANLFDAEHNSIFEHCNITFLARGISRSLLAQVTRQGTFRFTSASQQYQDYRNYPMSLRFEWDKNPRIKQEYELALNEGLRRYIRLIDLGEKPEEARQVLPPAATVNLEITANARNLARFFRARLCKRNVGEMESFAWKLYYGCIEWLPELFKLVHAPCAMDGKCNQGKMSCGKPFARIR